MHRFALALLFAATSFAGDRVLFLVGENLNGSHETIPAFAQELERRLGLTTEVRHGRGQRVPDLSGLEDADLVVLFLRMRQPSPEQAAALERWFAAGKPAIALRTTSHAFEGDPAWFPPRFGGHWKSHAHADERVTAVAYPPNAMHPILNGVPRVLELPNGGTYDSQPLLDGALPLMFARTGDLPAQPAAWTFEGRFATSLGTRGDFEDEGFRELLANAILWGLGREVPAGGAFGGAFGGEVSASPSAPMDLPAPPAAILPEGAVPLTDWSHYDPSVEPRSIRVSVAADTSAGGPSYTAGRWTQEGGVLVARPGFGDLVSAQEFADYHLHLDFLLPAEPAWVPDDFRGASGVYLAGRYEIQLLDSWRKDLTTTSVGAVNGLIAPAVNAARPPGSWQGLDVTFSHHAGELPRISAWLGGVPVLSNVTPEQATAYGFLGPVPGDLTEGGAGVRHMEGGAAAEACDWGRDGFSVHARFRGRGDGSLVSKCPPEGEWVADAKVLFLRGGRLVYDIGWVGALNTGRQVNDGEWHRVVLTSSGGHARLFLDGDLVGEKQDFRAEDRDDFVIKVGAANDNFGGAYDGEVLDVRFYQQALSNEEAAALSGGADPGGESAWSWGEPQEGQVPSLARGTPLPAPIRLQADASPVRFANLWVAPLGEVDHAGLITTWDAGSYARGEEVYQGLCRACHGDDGTRTLNPKARAFASAPLQNGADPLSLFRTVSDGFQDMPSNMHLTPAQRYDVIHYVRERFLKDQNPSQYVPLDEAYIAALPKGLYGRAQASAESVLPPRDFGPALASQLGGEVGAALTVRLDDDATLCYDTQTMESAGAWTGGFLDLAKTQHYQQRGEGKAAPAGEPIEGLAYGWGHDGSLDWDRSRRPERGLLPIEWLDYHGHYAHGDRLVLSYAIDGREVWELPGIDRSSGMPVFTHRLSVAQGDVDLVLGLVEGDDVSFEQRAADDLGRAWSLAVARGPAGRISVAALVGDGVLEQGARVQLRLAAGPAAEALVLRFAAESEEQLAAFRVFLDNVRERSMDPQPRDLTRGGSPRWHDLITQGQLGQQTGAYAFDTIELPDDNPWNAWVRTSAIAFFEDGRAAVTTYGGDVWIVSGLDDDLQRVTWRRFAAGLFEPMGAAVIDGLVYVTCRDRITRLHDLNDDGEADFYESFFPDPDVSTFFHAFNFDLQVDGQGNLFYAKAGQYTSYALPGAVLKIPPTGGRDYEVHCTGLRTPNGMGILPDGRVTVSDNQGNWIPASKVSLCRQDGFYGVFKAINVGGPGEQIRDDFDPPVIWMPQSLDSSSGGQLWVDDERWGPLAGRLLHTSFGKGWLYPMSLDERGQEVQAAIWRMPFQFAAGLQRARVNPADGQVYAVGLSGWQGPAGGGDGCLQRVRYTGAEETLLLDARVGVGRIDLTFSAALDPAAVADLTRYRSRRWNYKWARQYGSANYSISRPGEEGQDEISITGAELSQDGRRLSVRLAELVPCHQLELSFRLLSAAGEPLEQRVYLTVHQVPPD